MSTRDHQAEPVTEELSETARLKCRITWLEQQAEECRQEATGLRQRLLELEQEHQELRQRYSLAENTCNQQTVYQVSLRRLYEAGERDQVIAAISEIVVDLVGADAFVLYQLAAGSSVLRQVTAIGVDDELLREVPLDDADLAQTHLAGSQQPRLLLGGHELVALVPLRLRGVITGALAILSLLPHKSGLEQLDQDLLELLATHAPIAQHLADPDPDTSQSPAGKGSSS